MSKYKVVFDGFDTEEEALTFARWFSNQGEQCDGLSDMYELSHDGKKSPNVDCHAMYEKWKADDNGEVNVKLQWFD